MPASIAESSVTTFRVIRQGERWYRGRTLVSLGNRSIAAFSRIGGMPCKFMLSMKVLNRVRTPLPGGGVQRGSYQPISKMACLRSPCSGSFPKRRSRGRSRSAAA